MAIAQEDMKVKITYHPEDKKKEIVVEITNKSVYKIGITNKSMFENAGTELIPIFMDEKNGVLERSYLYDWVPISDNSKTRPKLFFIDPKSSVILKYPYEYLIRFCKTPENIRTFKISYHIRYYAIEYKENEKWRSSEIDGFSKTFTVKK
jgi:hypothetical protein